MEALLTIFFLMILILPVFGSVAEKYIAYTELQLIGDSVDASCIAVYNSIDIPEASRGSLVFDEALMKQIFEQVLCENLALNPDLTPGPGSIAKGRVVIESLILEKGIGLELITLHVNLRVPVKPGIMTRYLSSESVTPEFRIHRDCEFPVI